MNKPLVSMAMAVYNGQRYLEQSLDALLAQDYDNFELIILDNQSTDRTREICLEYAKKDSRIRYILDDRRRNGHDAQTYMSSLARGKYHVSVCDDDLWESNYISRLVSILESDEEIGLVFSNCYHIDDNGNRMEKRPILKKSKLYKSTNSKIFNFSNYVLFRYAAPTLLGVHRKSVFQKALPYVLFDQTGRDVDNLLVLKLLTMTKVHSVDEPLFYFRIWTNKHRRRWDKFGCELEGKSAIRNRFDDIKHQIKFNHEVFKVIDGTDFGVISRMYLKFATIIALMVRLFVLPIYLKLKVFFRIKP
jgi:glycosyltransferase involved in cell wall biosynthesis